ncbi:unnamed protein product, partial [Ascophyllum nodosum]
VIVENTVDGLSGIYTYQWDPCSSVAGPGQDSLVFEMDTGSEVYRIFATGTDVAWSILPTFATSYPKYRTFDDAQHPADITQNWIGFDSAVDDGTD